MTTKTDALARTDRDFEPFPELPPREDMQNSLHLDDPAHQAALRRHFNNDDTTIVLSEIQALY